MQLTDAHGDLHGSVFAARLGVDAQHVEFILGDDVGNVPQQAFDRQGLLRDISDVIAKDKLDVLRVNTESRGEYANMQITVRIKELQQLSKLLVRLQHVQNVIEVGRG